MKAFFTGLFAICSFSFFAQNIGINTNSPRESLEVGGGLIVEANNSIIGNQSGSAINTYDFPTGVFATDSSGVLYDDGGTLNYSGGQEKDFYISGSGFDFINLTILSFETEAPYDSLTITNILTGQHVVTLSGNASGSYSIPGSVGFHFKTNAFNNLSGFEIRWDKVYPNPASDIAQDVGSGGRLQFLANKNALRSGFVDDEQWDSQNTGKNSIAVGQNTEAIGDQSAALGKGTKVTNNDAMATGRYNEPISNAAFQIGNGSINNRSNAVTMDFDGDIHSEGTYYGNGSGLTNLNVQPPVWNTSNQDAYYNNGDVGIGTTSPDGKLEVYQNSSLSDPHILLHENGNDYSRLRFQNNNGSNYWTIAAYIASNHRNDRLNFWNGTGGDVMTITGDGEVGIGVGISPKTTLHVGNGQRVLFGIDTLGNGDKLMFLPDLHAFRVGTVATGAASTYWNRDSIGLYSFASGLNTRAQGYGATAMGRDTEATNSYAFASGFFSNADGQYSTAMGFNTDAFGLGSTALGYSSDAEANYTFAAGYFAEAQAIYSIALGNGVRAQSYGTMAIGRYNLGGGDAESWVDTDNIFEIGIGTNASSRANAMTVRKNGNVGIGTAAPAVRLHVADGVLRVGSLEDISDGGSFMLDFDATLRPFSNNGRSLGNSTKRWSAVYATNGTINTSDVRDKKSIVDLSYGLEEILSLRPVSFEWKDRDHEGTKLGLIAQELQVVLPEVVVDKEWEMDEETNELTEKEADRLGVYYSDLIPVLIKGMQEQQVIIDALEARIRDLENE